MILKKNRFIFICLLLLSSICLSAYGHLEDSASRSLIVFFSPACKRCSEVKHELMPAIEDKFKGKITVEYRDLSDLENYKFLLGLKEKYDAQKSKIAVPLFFFKGDFLTAESLTKERLEALIEKGLLDSGVHKKELPVIDLLGRFKNFSPLVIISAGLIDGINPCAFTVMVFFISFLTLQGYRRRELVTIGLAFMLTVFVTYILIGIGIFGFLYRMKNFWLAAKIFNYSIGAFSIILGGFALYDFFNFKKTRSSDGMLLQLPRAVKNQIHSVIGLHYRKTNDNKDGIDSRLSVFRLASSAMITGFLVSLLEAVCTGQTYLPTISFVLKTTTLKVRAFGYLVLYNLMFIVPLFAIFVFALWGMRSEQFAGVLKKNMLPIKILMALLFLGLGIFLIWRA